MRSPHSPLALLPLLLLGCRSYTIPVGRVPDYAANHPVLTTEGYMVSRADGGELELVPRRGKCLSKISARATGGDPLAANLVPTERLVCASHRVTGVRSVEVDTLLRIDGEGGPLIVNPRDVVALHVQHPYEGEENYAPTTNVRSPGLIAGGSVLLAAGLAGGFASFAALANVQSGGMLDFSFIDRIAWGAVGAISMTAGLGGGIPMIVVGAQQVRDPFVPNRPRLEGATGNAIWSF